MSEKTLPYEGETKTVKCFALLPKNVQGNFIWLRYYFKIYRFTWDPMAYSRKVTILPAWILVETFLNPSKVRSKKKTLQELEDERRAGSIARWKQRDAQRSITETESEEKTLQYFIKEVMDKKQPKGWLGVDKDDIIDAAILYATYRAEQAFEEGAKSERNTIIAMMDGSNITAHNLSNVIEQCKCPIQNNPYKKDNNENA